VSKYEMETTKSILPCLKELYFVAVEKFNSCGAVTHVGISKGHLIGARLRLHSLEKTAITFKTSLDNAYTSFLIG